MPTLEPFWRLVETRPSRSAVMTDWRTAAGGDLQAVMPLLTLAGRMATSYPNPKGGLPMRVVHHKDGTVVAVDVDDWEHRIPLSVRGVSLYQLDLRKVRVALCDVLESVKIVRSPVEQTAVCVQIGNWEPKKAADFPVYLLMCSTRMNLRRQVLELQHRNQRPAILLTPTRANWDDELDELARRGKMLLVPLCEILQPQGDALIVTSAWEEYLQAFCQMVEVTLPGNYRNKRPAAKRSERAANIEKIEKFMEEHLLAARDHAYSRKQYGMEPVLLPRPEQQDIARQLDLSPSAVSRCFKDPQAKILRILWDTANSLDDVMKYKRQR